jgi:hypothetical protein
MTARSRTARWLGPSFACLLALPGTADGQIIDARLVPAGVLRVAFTPQYQSWDRMFAADGSVIPLGRYLSADSAGSNLFPTLSAPESAVRSIIGDPDYRLTLGSLTTTVDADVRRFPFEFSLGLNRWLSLSATIPIVVTRVNAVAALDSSQGNAGWNQGTVESASATGRASINSVVSQLEASANALETRIGSGFYGCPGAASCLAAQSLLVRTRALRANLIILSGSPQFLSPVPPAAPVAGSPAALLIAQAISQISSDLQAAGVPGIAGAMPFPARRLATTDVETLRSSATFGYETTIPPYTKRPSFGDLEVGARIGLVQRPKSRIVLTANAKLPTGARDLPDNLVDIGTGDRQTDMTGGMEVALDAGVVSVTAAASYTLQLKGPIRRRVTPPDHPIALAGTTALLTRDPGEIICLSAYPALRLANDFRVYGLFSYFNKTADHHTGDAATPAGLDPAVLDQQTAMRSLSVGGGLAYRSTGRTAALPIEAGLTWQTAISGSGGFAPRMTVVTMYVRAFYRLWGGG